jgi:hypothetical protein
MAKKTVAATPAKLSSHVELTEMPSSSVAQALTNYEFNMFKNIQRREFARTKKPSITKMIDHFNKVNSF